LFQRKFLAVAVDGNLLVPQRQKFVKLRFKRIKICCKTLSYFELDLFRSKPWSQKRWHCGCGVSDSSSNRPPEDSPP